MKSFYAIIFIVSTISCSFLRKLTEGLTVSIQQKCIDLGSGNTFTLAITGGDGNLTSVTSVTLKSQENTEITATCQISTDSDSQFTCRIDVSNIPTPGNYTLTSISGADGEHTLSLGEQTLLEIAETYTLGTQTASQTINITDDENDSFQIVFSGEFSGVPQIFASSTSGSAIQGCTTKNSTIVVCKPTASEMPDGQYQIHYKNGCDTKIPTGVIVQVSSSGTGTGTGSGSGTGNGTGTGSGTGNGTETNTTNGNETNSESKSAFITLSTVSLFMFAMLF